MPTIDGTLDLEVDGSPLVQPLTDTELRASEVSVADAAALAKLELIRALLDGTLTVTGTQTDALTDTQLRASALSVTDTNPPQTDALTNTELRAADVAVTLDGESVAVTATDLDVRDLVLSSDSVRQTQRPMSSYVATLTSPQTGTVAASITNKARLLRLDGGSKPNNTADTYCTVTIKIGATAVFTKTLQVGEPFGGQVCLEGDTGEDITIDMTGDGSVEFNLRYEEFT